MAIAFRGASTHGLDDKSRLIVPKRFLDQLPPVENNMVLTASRDGCLLLLEKRTFEEISLRIGDDPLDDSATQRDLRRLFLGHAEDVRPDKAGRIVIPKVLQTYAGIGAHGGDADLILVGTGRAIEVWAPDRWRDAVSGAGRGSFASEATVEAEA